ncbi:hypothetical protein [Streptomyces sp. BSE6.1]|uniref:hypothetical protein n=1 Tax=Streptomyces sp. BSE6.1 TaxID=2605730 RepID=UPI001F239DB6|nr:hypothetical protein [Streptomyces sp. BSE6.1]
MCGCGKNGTRSAFEVVLNGGNGRVAFSTRDRAQADRVAKNYPGSVVRPTGTRQPRMSLQMPVSPSAPADDTPAADNADTA